MKKNNLKIGLLFLMSLLFLNGCQDECYYYEEYMDYEEILADRDVVKNSFEVTNDFAIKKPSSIYSYQDYLFVAEQNEGIHILNNSNPASPLPLKFIKLKGNNNFVVANNILLADNGADLLSINISDLNNITLQTRTEGINNNLLRNDNKIVAGYNIIVKKRKVACNGKNEGRGNVMFSDATTSANYVNAGKGGSLAKFTIVNNYLYIAHSSEMMPIDISNPAMPIKKQNIAFSEGNIETVFPYKEHLYFGTTTGVLIYNCKGNPETPSYVATLRHILGCDPVVVENDICFSTVRNGSTCRNTGMSMLNIYNVSNLPSSQYLSSANLTNPYGLGVKGNLLFICEATNGLSIYNWDATTNRVTFKHNYTDIHAYDVIVNGNTLIVTAENGLFQFDCSNPDNIQYLSTLSNF